MTGSRLCLNMIVKNESGNIERCLRSVTDSLACWVILDTGSTDDTKLLIKAFFAARGIPGELHDGTFQDFSQARNDALDLARASPLKFDYILFADADMELVVSDHAFANALTADAYRVRQESGISYWNARLVRRDGPGRYVGVTHEYLDVGSQPTVALDGVYFIDHTSGSNRVGKFQRDAAMLRDALVHETDAGLRARYTFYLANSLRDAGEHAAALDAYLERSRLGGWDDEIYVSLFNAGQLQEALGHPAREVLATFVNATTVRPTRAEALHAAACHCRRKRLHEPGYQYAARGIAISRPAEALFLSDWVYQHGLLDEFSLHAYWTGRFADCVAACDRLLALAHLPVDFRERVAKNRQFALARLHNSEGDHLSARLSS